MKNRFLAWSGLWRVWRRKNGVPAGIAIGLQAAIHLLRLQVGMLLVPLLDQTLIRRKEGLLDGLLYAFPVDDSGDALLPHGKRFRDLPDRQAFHGAQMLHSAFKEFGISAFLIVRHSGSITEASSQDQSELVSHDGKAAQGFDLPGLFPALGLYLTRGDRVKRPNVPGYQALERASQLVSHEAR